MAVVCGIIPRGMKTGSLGDGCAEECQCDRNTILIPTKDA